MNLTQKEKSVIKKVYALSMKGLGILLIFFFILLFVCILYSFVYDTIKMYHLKYQNIYFTASSLSVGIIIGIIQTSKAFNITFNYVLCLIVSPGKSDQFFSVPSTQVDGMHSPFIYDPSKTVFNKTMIHRKINSNQLKFCQKCKLPKPQRAHHCSICGKCVLKMDHHCPWLNECVGYFNHRYFLNFLFYIALGTGYCSILNIPIMVTNKFNTVYHFKSFLFQIMWPLNITLFTALIAFNLWSWYLAYKGYTTIEFMEKSSKGRGEFHNKSNGLLNLRVIFGNVSNWIQIFMPSVRDLQSNGVVWDIEDEESYEQLNNEEI